MVTINDLDGSLMHYYANLSHIQWNFIMSQKHLLSFSQITSESMI